MDELQNTIANTASLFRSGAEGEGSRGLLDILNAITARMDQPNRGARDISHSDISLLNKIIQAQERGDFIYVADLLEYELPRSGFWD